MKAFRVKSFVVVFMLLLLGLVTVGCGKQKTGWVNTSSMPGQTFTASANVKKQAHNTAIVYLGQDRTQQRSSFGPNEVSFDFEDLK